MSSELRTNTIVPASGTNLTLGSNGDTVEFASGTTVSGLSTGKVLQVVTWSDNTHITYAAQTSTWTAMSGIAASITPTSASSKIIVQMSLNISSESYSAFRYTRDGTQILLGSSYASNTIASTGYNGYTPITPHVMTVCYFDSPSTTSAVEYSLDYLTPWASGGVVYYNRGYNADSYRNTGTSIIILMEIEG